MKKTSKPQISTKRTGVYISKNLEAFLRGIVPSHTEVLIPARNEIALYCDDIERSKHMMMGRFYEEVSGAFYGGIVLEGRSIRDNPNQLSLNFSELEQMISWENKPEKELFIKPDIINVGKSIGESKACKNGSTLHILDGQTERYRKIQLRNPSHPIYFAIYRHSFHGIKSDEITVKPDEEIVQDLSLSTMYSIRIPLSILLHLHGTWYGNLNPKLSYRHNGTRYQCCTMAKEFAMKTLFQDPEIIIDMLNLNPKNYKITRIKSPEDFTVNTTPIQSSTKLMQFPIVMIEDENHEEWINKFVRSEKRLGTDIGTIQETEDIPF
nr:hypothetical protein [Nanoarchaeum sp.]